MRETGKDSGRLDGHFGGETNGVLLGIDRELVSLFHEECVSGRIEQYWKYENLHMSPSYSSLTFFIIVW